MTTLLPFADPQDVADRWRPLTDSECAIAEVLCADASALIRARFPGVDAQTDTGAVDPQILKMVVAGMVKRALIAPMEGVSQQSETLGSYSQSQTFANPMRNVFLTAADLTLIIGYKPRASSHSYANDTCARGTGTQIVYGNWW